MNWKYFHPFEILNQENGSKKEKGRCLGSKVLCTWDLLAVGGEGDILR